MRTAMSTATPEMISQSGGSTVLFFIYPKPHSVIVLFFFWRGGRIIVRVLLGCCNGRSGSSGLARVVPRCSACVVVDKVRHAVLCMRHLPSVRQLAALGLAPLLGGVLAPRIKPLLAPW